MKFVKNQIPRPTLKPLIISKSHLGGSHPILIPKHDMTKPIEDSKFFKIVQKPPPPRKQKKN
jgi:hypothetical protein